MSTHNIINDRDNGGLICSKCGHKPRFGDGDPTCLYIKMNQQNELENKWREESLVEYKNYMTDADLSISELHKTYLYKVVEVCKTIESPFNRTVAIVGGVNFMAGYLAACEKRQEELETLRAENEKLRDLVKRASEMFNKNVRMVGADEWLKEAEEVVG